jgi:hypothetical protein
LKKSDILALFDLTERQFFVAFAASNSSNVLPLDENVKFGDVVEFMETHPNAANRFDFSGWGEVSVEQLADFSLAVSDLFQQRTVRTQESLAIPAIAPDQIHKQRRWIEFCSETFDNGNTFRRQQLFDRLITVIRGQVLEPATIFAGKQRKDKWLKANRVHSKNVAGNIRLIQSDYRNIFEVLRVECGQPAEIEDIPAATLEALKTVWSKKDTKKQSKPAKDGKQKRYALANYFLSVNMELIITERRIRPNAMMGNQKNYIRNRQFRSGMCPAISPA